MSVPIKYDYRYKVNQEAVEHFRRLREKGLSYQKIADFYSVSAFTVYYWCNTSFRKRKQKLNSKRTHPKGSKTAYEVATRRRQWKQYPISYILDVVTNAKNEKRCSRHKVFGKTISEWEPILQKYKTGGQKVF